MYKVLVSNDKQEICIGVNNLCRKPLRGHIALPVNISWDFRYDSRVGRDSRDYDLCITVLCFKFYITIHKWSTGYGKPWKRTDERNVQGCCKECMKSIGVPISNLADKALIGE